MLGSQAGQPRQALVALGVVLHRTRAQRIEIRVDRHVERREVGVMPHHVELAQLGQAWAARRAVLARNQLIERTLGYVAFRQDRRRASWPAGFKEQRGW